MAKAVAQTTTSLPVVDFSKIGNYETFKIYVNGSNKGPIRQDTIGTRNPKFLNANKFTMLPVTSRHFLGEGNGYLQTLYVPGSSSIFIKDVINEKGELVPGLLSQGYNIEEETNRSKQRKLAFHGGLISVKDFDGGDPRLKEFLNTHESNMESPAGKHPNHSVLRLFRFQPLKAEERAVTKVAGFEETFAGLEIVKSLRTQKGDKFEYDNVKMDAIVSIFDLSEAKVLGQDSPAQKFEIVLRHCQANPVEFARLYKSSVDGVKMDIGKAINFNIIIKDGSTYSYINSAGTPEELIKDGSDEAVEKMALNLISNANKKGTLYAIKHAIVQHGASS